MTYAAMYASAISLGALLLALGDHVWPDPLNDWYDEQWRFEAMRWNVATLAVSYPLYLFLTRKHLWSFQTQPERRASPVRRWLTYLTLFAAASVGISCLIWLIGNYLGGELALQTAVKILTVLVLAGAVFAYYFWEIRLTDRAGRDAG